MDFYVNLNSSSVIVGGQPTEAATTSETGTPSNVPAEQQSGGLGIWSWILIYVVVLGGYFWFMSRSNKKKEKQVIEMRKALKPGDTVCTTGGFYGKIVDVGEDVFVIEFGTNKGIRIPVTKQDVIAAKEPVMTAPKLES